jgi:hypothetical protein
VIAARESERARGVYRRWEFKTFGAPVWGEFNLVPGPAGTWRMTYTPVAAYPPDGYVVAAPFTVTIDTEADTAYRNP